MQLERVTKARESMLNPPWQQAPALLRGTLPHSKIFNNTEFAVSYPNPCTDLSLDEANEKFNFFFRGSIENLSRIYSNDA